MKCEICGSRENLIVHHISYEKNKTIRVCRNCHGKIHRNKKHQFHPSDKKTRFSLFMDFFGKRTSMLRIIDFLIERRPFDVTKEEIIEETGISRNAFYRGWKRLEGYNIVIATRQIGKSSMYVLNDENEIVQQLLRLELILGKIAIERAEKEIKLIPV